MFSNIFGTNKKSESTLTERLKDYLDSRSEFSNVEVKREDIQFSLGNDNRLTIKIKIIGSKYFSHTLHFNGGVSHTDCRIKNPSDPKQVMLALFDQTIGYFKVGGKRDEDVVDTLVKVRRALLTARL